MRRKPTAPRLNRDIVLRGRLDIAVIALLAYGPLLLSDVGRVVADTKAYLYLDPARLLARAPWMWHSEVGLGTVTHQNIGFVWPIGPFYWLGEVLGLPDWVTQRLWMGSILLVAGLGTRWLLQTLGWRGPALLVSALAYMLSPYLLNFLSWVSPILLPWAALPWLLGLTDRALRSVGWRHAAAFGLTTLTCGGVNATSLLLVGLGPVCWLIWTGFEGSLPWRRVAMTAVRIGVAVFATSLWWIAGIVIQAKYGLPTLHLTENYRVVSDAATAPELFRGLGYWYFYGQGHVGPWIESSNSYTRWALPLSFGLPLLGLFSAAIVKFRHRGHMLVLLAVGLLVGIGAHPYDDPSILGRMFRELTLTDAGLALRSTARVLPLVVLATAVFLGAAVSAIGRWRPRWENAVAALICALAVANLSPAWQGKLLGEIYQRDENIPAAWSDAAAYLDRGNSDTRVLEVPGSDFAAYRWGHSGDPVLPGLIDRDHVARELIPQGSPASAEIIVALDREFQENRFDPDGLAPLARLLGVGEVVVRSDLQYERYRTPRPSDLWAQLVDAPGFDKPVTFGDSIPNIAGPERPLIDAHTLSRPTDHSTPPAVAVLPVREPKAIVRVAEPDYPIVVVGDAAGIVAAAGEGFLQPGRPILFSASLTEENAQRPLVIGPDALVVLTDTNRLQGRRWGTIRETHGFTERYGENHDPSNLADQPLQALPDHVGTQTVSVSNGLKVDASGYGNPVTYTPGDQPYHAVDGRYDTAWRVGAFSDVRGEWLTITLDKAAVINGIRVLQAAGPNQNRWITRLRIHTGQATLVRELNNSSRTRPGQMLPLEPNATSEIRLEILATDVGPQDYYGGFHPVGFAEVVVPGVTIDQTILLPTDLADARPADFGANVAVILSRERVEPRDADRHDPELALDRTVTLPWPRTLKLRGEARLSTHTHDSIWNSPTGPIATASGSLQGNLPSRPRSAFDHNPDTAWQSPINAAEGSWLQLDMEAARSFDDLHLVYRADGLHSAPLLVRVLADGREVGSTRTTGTLQTSSGSVHVHLDVGPFTARALRLEFLAVRPRLTLGWTTGQPEVLPIGIVAVKSRSGIPAAGFRPDTVVSASAAPNPADGCRDDLIWINDKAIPVRVVGSAEQAALREALVVEACGPPVDLEAGPSRIRTAAGRDTGIDIDRLVLDSGDSNGNLATTNFHLPEVSAMKQGRTRMSVEIGAGKDPLWLILGQSHNPGWSLRDGDGTDFGPPQLVDGYANGWLVEPSETNSTTFTLEWKPQRAVWIALATSLFATVVCLLGFFCGGRSVLPTKEPEVTFVNPLHKRSITSNPIGALFGLVIAGFTLINLPGWHSAAALVGILGALTITGRVGHRAASLAAATAMAVTAVLIALEQIRERHPRDFVWPQFFDQFHVLAVLGILLTAAAALEELLERRSTISGVGDFYSKWSTSPGPEPSGY